MSIKVEDISFIYSPNTPFEFRALDSVNCEFPESKVSAVIGATGSGKTTLVQLFNGLEKPTSGKLHVLGMDTSSPECNIRDLRFKVGLVFQYPEYQFFEETVELDVGFGPLMMKLPQDEIKRRVMDSLNSLGLDYNAFANRSPYHLSGGEQRRVAIASILAMEPEIIVLDEPTAGLDFSAKSMVMNLLIELTRKTRRTVIIVTHDIELLLKYTDHAVLINKGQVIKSLGSKQYLELPDYLNKLNIEVPEILKLIKALMNNNSNILPDQALEALKDTAKAADLCMKCCR